MASRLLHELLKRQNNGGNDPYDGDGYDGYDGRRSWWWSPTGLAVRYTVVVVFFGLLLLYFVGGYWHARRRLRKGLPLLAYHRWMIGRRAQPYFNPGPDYRGQPYYPNAGAPPPESYAMDGYYRPPPPAYANDGTNGPPPGYQPPEGASKVMADQNYFPQPQGHQTSAPTAAAHGGAEPGSSSVAVAVPEPSSSGALQRDVSASAHTST